jgi:hypothetical protein
MTRVGAFRLAPRLPVHRHVRLARRDHLTAANLATADCCMFRMAPEPPRPVWLTWQRFSLLSVAPSYGIIPLDIHKAS